MTRNLILIAAITVSSLIAGCSSTGKSADAATRTVASHANKYRCVYPNGGGNWFLTIDGKDSVEMDDGKPPFSRATVQKDFHNARFVLYSGLLLPDGTSDGAVYVEKKLIEGASTGVIRLGDETSPDYRCQPN